LACLAEAINSSSQIENRQVRKKSKALGFYHLAKVCLNLPDLVKEITFGHDIFKSKSPEEKAKYFLERAHKFFGQINESEHTLLFLENQIK